MQTDWSINIPFRTQQFLLLAAQAGSFHKAARTFGVHPSVLARHIDRLENDLGVKLFDRDRNSFSITEPGRIFVREIQEAMTHAARAWDLTRYQASIEQGPFRLGYSAYIHTKLVPMLERLDFPDSTKQSDETTGKRSGNTRAYLQNRSCGSFSKPAPPSTSSMMCCAAGCMPPSASSPSLKKTSGSNPLCGNHSASASRRTIAWQNNHRFSPGTWTERCLLSAAGGPSRLLSSNAGIHREHRRQAYLERSPLVHPCDGNCRLQLRRSTAAAVRRAAFSHGSDLQAHYGQTALDRNRTVFQAGPAGQQNSGTP